MYRYNICFIKQGTKILLLNRKSAPLMGMWNGVGGKIEPGETILESVIREVYEETGIKLEKAADKGTVSWEVDGSRKGGMHLFIAELPEDYQLVTPKLMDEGILDWKELDWILDPDNQGIVQHVPFYLDTLYKDGDLYEHHCTFREGKLVDYQAIPLNVSVH